jgi:NTP pyrophosphatase (non-canonical NTP hydrolase)
VTTDELIDAVMTWGKSHNIDNPDKQALKLGEEYGELLSELCRGRYKSEDVEDALGDIGVVWIILGDILGYDVRSSLLKAYKIIEKRNGKTISGSFIKEGD